LRILVQHLSRYRYPRPATLGAHEIRLRPAAHARARIESYGLEVSGDAHVVWQQDPSGNFVAHARFDAPTPELVVAVELAVDIQPVNPFDFVLDPSAGRVPFSYGALGAELAPYRDLDDAALARGPLFDALRASLAPGAEGTPTIAWLVELNRVVAARVRYVLREEIGVWTPEETLAEGRGSCRDSAVLLVALLRAHGLAARFVSGYLVQLTDEGMLPEEPKGVGHDVADLHAWAEVFLPGAGWVGLDATSGLLAGEGHIPLACTASPRRAAPIDGTSSVAADEVRFELKVSRLGHEVRPTAPFTDDAWRELVAAGARTDETLARLGLRLTVGGEPTFNSRLHPELPEWNGEALGATKWAQGLALAEELLARLYPGGVMMLRQGKTYPGETLPRWTLELFGRRDGQPLWTAHSTARSGDRSADVRASVRRPQPGVARGAEDAALLPEARALADEIARRLGVDGFVADAFEDPRVALAEESLLPVDVEASRASLDDAEERRRLARLLDRGLARPAGFVLPLAPRGDGWASERWQLRRDRLYLLPGDAPLGLRLPLRSLGAAAPPPPWEEERFEPPDPRGPEAAAREKAREDERLVRLVGEGKLGREHLPAPAAPTPLLAPGVRTALAVEPRGGALCVFLPPLSTVSQAIALLAEIDAARAVVSAEVLLEGYPPPPGPQLARFSVAPDPGVVEVNLPPVESFAGHAALVETVFDAALRVGLHAEKYLLDGRQAGSGGGNHVTLGGPRPLESPFVRDPRLLASLVTFFQHHPSLSYLFTGLFVGPTSQAPRVDEARHDSLYELEIALERAFAPAPPGGEPPWLSDVLFRDLLVDVTGNTHRAELCIDKLFDWRTPHGRQGVLELRAFEMPPHPRMMSAQTQLVRALVAALAAHPYRHPLVRWGAALHDRFLLPTFLWRDFEEVLGFLAQEGLPHPDEVYRAFLELRCPVAGRLEAGDVLVEVRNALEPWPVLGEEPGDAGTSRYVDSSVERIEVRAEGMVPGRHVVLVNGHVLPLRPTGRAGEGAAGVRFRAWAPPRSLHAHLGVHHPLRIDVVDLWGARSLGACAYHVYHPEGRAYTAQPLTRFEAAARRAQRFTHEAPLRAPVTARPAEAHDDTPWTLDLRRYPLDRPPPQPRDPA
jgi:uncharacterized protein (DUF2126 family)/transglutaminase-like putative cysteine protease